MGRSHCARRGVVHAFAAGDSAAMTELLAADATVHGPVTDYRGWERVATVLDALVEVVTDVRVTRLLESAQGTAESFTAGGDGRQDDPVLLALAAVDAPATELRLMFRPLRTLRVGSSR